MSYESDLLDYYPKAPLLELGADADAVRRRLHPEPVVTYIVDRNITYPNVCVADCGFCAFYRRPKDGEGWTLSYEEIGAKIDEVKALGGVQILIPGGGGEILVQRVRDNVAKKKASADRWLEVMEIAHGEGLKTSCTMMYGIGETM
ncbi:MAG: hypothetical protein ACKOFX_08035, partial [Solirubrobacterales bacterium]